MENWSSQVFPRLLDQGKGKEGLLLARDTVWRTARQTLSPTFSASKMKSVRCVSKFTIQCVLSLAINLLFHKFV